jgi:hypothetical protein
MLQKLLTPRAGVNYDAVFKMYVFGTGLFLLFVVLQYVVQAGETVEGFWVIFAPFLPCAAWAQVVRGKHGKDEVARKDEAARKDQ